MEKPKGDGEKKNEFFITIARQLIALRLEYADLQDQLETTDSRIQAAQQRTEKAENALQLQRQLSNERDNVIRTLRQQLADTQAELAASKQELAAAKNEATVAREELENERKQHEQTQQQLQEARAAPKTPSAPRGGATGGPRPRPRPRPSRRPARPAPSAPPTSKELTAAAKDRRYSVDLLMRLQPYATDDLNLEIPTAPPPGPTRRR